MSNRSASPARQSASEAHKKAHVRRRRVQPKRNAIRAARDRRRPERYRATTPEQAVIDVLHELGQRVINDSVGTIRLHAGAVERDGRSLLLVGSSGKGKSTLTAALVQRGWGYSERKYKRTK